jgi:N-methylhydantoinase B
MQYPLRVRRFERARNTGGPGHHSGGDGIVRELEALADCEGTILSDRRIIPPYALGGGRQGAPGANAIRRADGHTEPLPGKSKFTLRRGDTLIIRTPGAGGWGA